MDLVGGIPTPLKNMKVSWDDDYPQYIWKNKVHVPNHQPVFHVVGTLLSLYTHEKMPQLLAIDISTMLFGLSIVQLTPVFLSKGSLCPFGKNW